MSYYYGSDGSVTTSSAEETSSEKEGGKGFVKTGYLADPKEAAKFDLIVDVGTEQRSTHIEGAICIPWNELLKDDGNPKSASGMSQVLGEAGVSSEDSVVIYGECDTCGGVPVTPFVFWAMRYLGHGEISILDGGIEGWATSGGPIGTVANSKPMTTYGPSSRSELLSNYAEITRGDVQLVDARSFQEFARGRIPGSTNIDCEDVLSEGEIKSGDELEDLFGRLEEDRKVVVYSDDVLKTATVWYALWLMGYDSSIYSWDDWKEYQRSESSSESGTNEQTKSSADDYYVRLG